jgi:putative membrane protein
MLAIRARTLGGVSWWSLMARNFVFVLLVILVLLLATIFAALNPGLIELDYAFGETEIQTSVALTIAFGVGWVFGLLCAGIVLLKTINERRKLRKSLRLAEAEVKTLRSMPIQDAD